MSPARHAKEALYELVAQVARAIANPHRLELLDLLVQGVYADQALELITASGRHGARLEAGVAEWQLAGHALNACAQWW